MRFTIRRVIGILASDTVFVNSTNISTKTRRQYCLGPYAFAFLLRNIVAYNLWQGRRKRQTFVLIWHFSSLWESKIYDTVSDVVEMEVQNSDASLDALKMLQDISNKPVKHKPNIYDILTYLPQGRHICPPNPPPPHFENYRCFFNALQPLWKSTFIATRFFNIWDCVISNILSILVWKTALSNLFAIDGSSII